MKKKIVTTFYEWDSTAARLQSHYDTRGKFTFYD